MENQEIGEILSTKTNNELKEILINVDSLTLRILEILIKKEKEKELKQ